LPKFDQLFDRAAPLIAAGDHQRDALPQDGGRWPVSVALRPPRDDLLSRHLDDLTAEAADLAGPDHWHTGRIGSAHLTVRALEGHRAVIRRFGRFPRRNAALGRTSTREELDYIAQPNAWF